MPRHSRAAQPTTPTRGGDPVKSQCGLGAVTKSPSVKPGARADTYTRVTAEIIAAMEHGAGEWHAPWFHNGTSAARPTNVASGRRYHGINTVALWATARSGRYSDGLWGTYRQWQEAGAQVRKGECSTTVVLWKQIASSDPTADHDDNNDDSSRVRMFAKAFSVFNVAQVDGYERPPVRLLEVVAGIRTSC